MGNTRDTEYLEAFGNRIRKLRTEKKLSQYELLDRVGIERSQIARIERGEINTTISTARLIAQGFEMSLSDFVDFD